MLWLACRTGSALLVSLSDVQPNIYALSERSDLSLKINIGTTDISFRQGIFVLVKKRHGTWRMESFQRKTNFQPHSKWQVLWASLVTPWIRICLPMQGTQVQSLVQEDSICCGANKPMHHNYWAHASVQFSSIAQSCLTLCDPVNQSTPSFPVHQTPGVHPKPCPLSQWCHPTISTSVVPFSSWPLSFPASGSFQMSQLFPSGGQTIGVSASTSVLPMNTQNWSPLGWNGWISLQSKGLSRVFSNTTVQKHQFFGAQLSL